MWMLMHLMLSQRSLRLSSFLFILYPIFCSEAVISTILSSMSFTHASASVILLWIPVSVLFISLCLFFSSCSVQFSCSVVSDSLQPHGLQNARPPYPSPTPGACSNSCPSSEWCHPTISSSVIRFSSCLQSFPASGSFLMSQLLTSGGQSVSGRGTLSKA